MADVTITNSDSTKISVAGATVAYSDLNVAERVPLVQRIIDAILGNVAPNTPGKARNLCRKIYGWMQGLPSYLLDVDQCADIILESLGVSLRAANDDDVSDPATSDQQKDRASNAPDSSSSVEPASSSSSFVIPMLKADENDADQTESDDLSKLDRPIRIKDGAIDFSDFEEFAALNLFSESDPIGLVAFNCDLPEDAVKFAKTNDTMASATIV